MNAKRAADQQRDRHPPRAGEPQPEGGHAEAEEDGHLRQRDPDRDARSAHRPRCGVETGASRSRRSSLVLPPARAASPRRRTLALIAIAQPSRPGVTNWMVSSDSSSTRSASREYFGGCPRRRDVGAVDERAERPACDRRAAPGRVAVVRDDRVAVLLDRRRRRRPCVPRRAPRQVVGVLHVEGCRRTPPSRLAGRSSIRRDIADLDHADLAVSGWRRRRRTAPGTSAGRRSRRTPPAGRAGSPSGSRGTARRTASRYGRLMPGTPAR